MDGERTDSTAPKPTAATATAALDWNDRAACKAWLDDLRGLTDDVMAAARDQARPPAKRELGRAAVARLLVEASQSLEEQLAYAARGLASDDGPEHGDPAGTGAAVSTH